MPAQHPLTLPMKSFSVRAELKPFVNLERRYEGWGRGGEDV